MARKPGSPRRRRGPSLTLSFDDWVARDGGDLLRFARVTAHDDDAVDLVQDALIAVFGRWGELSRPELASAYARRVIVNSHISRWRRWRRRVTSVDPTLLDIELVPPTTQDAVIAARQVLAALPHRQRAAVYLRFYDDLPYREIATILGCRETTARSYVHRALAALEVHLQEDR